MKRIFVLNFYFFALVFTGFTQQNGENYRVDDTYLRACITWNDSTVYDRSSKGSYDYVVYRFEIKNLFWGKSESREIYIRTHPAALLQFNPQLNLGKTYWWTLRKTDECIDNQHVYSHSGNF